MSLGNVKRNVLNCHFNVDDLVKSPFNRHTGGSRIRSETGVGIHYYLKILDSVSGTE